MPQNQFPGVPVDKASDVEHRRDLARAVNGLLRGERNATGQVTLTASSTTSTISDSRITADTVAILMPLTAHAAAAVAGLWQTAAAGAITLTHASTADVDKTFYFVLVG